MSTEIITAYRVVCDAPGCDNATEPEAGPELADEAAGEAGWHLDDEPDNDLCPEHNNN